MLNTAPHRPISSMRYSVYSLIAVAIALMFFFPFYWSLSTSLRNPLDTFTVSGLGIPFLNFEPTLNNWIDQLKHGEAQRALTNSTIISVAASLLAILLGTPAAYAEGRICRWRRVYASFRERSQNCWLQPWLRMRKR